MSLFYNRDRNISGVELLPSFSFSPNYGSSVSFNCKNNKLQYNNNTYSILPSTANNIVATCSFNFTVNETDAQKITNFFESQSGTGAFAISDNSEIYRIFTGYANSFGVEMIQNNLYNIKLDFSVERNSSFLNWSGKSFVNYDFVAWATGQTYLKYQPVYFAIQGEDKLSNFYYATQDHNSLTNNAPTNSEYWSQNLFYENDIGLSVETQPTVNVLNFKNSFAQRVKENENVHFIQSLKLSYKNISDFKLKSILHFLENNLGYRRFEFDCPKIYNRPKIYYADSWSHTWNYEDSNNLEISLVEDPMGIKNSKDSFGFILYQKPDSQSFSANFTPKENVSVVDATGKKDLVYGPYSITWPEISSRTLKGYRGYQSIDCSRQNLAKVNLYQSADIVNLNLNKNIINSFNLRETKNVNSVNLEYNILESVSFAGCTGLKNLNLSHNQLQILNTSGCLNLTGVNLNYNAVSQSSLSNVLDSLSNGVGESGAISVIGDLNFASLNATPQSAFDYSCICNLDYRYWTQSYKDLSLPISPTGFVDAGTQCIWLNNAQTRQNDSSYFLNWQSSFNNYTVHQDWSPFSSTWITAVPNQIFSRSAYKFYQTLLTGSGINNTGDYLSAFVVAQASSDEEMCLLNFSESQDYGLFWSGRQFQFRNGAEVFVIASNASTNQYYNIGFVRNSTDISGYINGDLFNTSSVSVSDLSSVKISVGSQVSSNKYWQGNIAEVLVYTKNSEFALNPSFHKPYNARFGTIVS